MNLMASPIVSKSTYLSLAIANLLPLYGVLFLGWEVLDVVVFYWVETIIIGLFNVLKIAVCRGQPPKDDEEQAERLGGFFPFMMRYAKENTQDPPERTDSGYKDVNEMSRLFVVVFFLIHYNFFIFGQFMLMSGLLDFGGNTLDVFRPLASLSAVSDEAGYLLSSLLFMVGSHAHSFWVHYILGEEYRRMDMGSQMFQPYGRIIIQQLVVIIGAFFVMLFNAPVFLVILLVALKLLADLAAHRMGHDALHPNTSS